MLQFGIVVVALTFVCVPIEERGATFAEDFGG